jgi:hypothetical protein
VLFAQGPLKLPKRDNLFELDVDQVFDWSIDGGFDCDKIPRKFVATKSNIYLYNLSHSSNVSQFTLVRCYFVTLTIVLYWYYNSFWRLP